MKHNHVLDLQQEANLTQRQMIVVLKHFRRSTEDRGIVEPGFKRISTQLNRLFTDYFDAKQARKQIDLLRNSVISFFLSMFLSLSISLGLSTYYVRRLSWGASKK